MTEPRQVAIVHDYDGLHRAIRERVDAIGMTRDQIDTTIQDDFSVPWQGGYASKILAPVPFKTLGRTSLGPMLAVLGLKIVLVEDPEAMRRIADLGVRRLRPVKCSKPLRNGLANVPEIRSLVAKELHKSMQRNGRKGGRKSGETRRSRKAKVPRWKRRAIARKAAQARWRKVASSPDQASASSGS